MTITRNGQSISFMAAGVPSPQGSKVFKGVRGGRGVLIDQDKNLGSWRSVVAAACPLEAPLTCGVALEVEFRYNRPKSHFGSRKGKPYLKGTAPIFKTSAPDTDKLVRAVNDALTGIAFADDALVVHITASKVYTVGTAGAKITITPLSEP